MDVEGKPPQPPHGATVVVRGVSPGRKPLDHRDVCPSLNRALPVIEHPPQLFPQFSVLGPLPHRLEPSAGRTFDLAKRLLSGISGPHAPYSVPGRPGVSIEQSGSPTKRALGLERSLALLKEGMSGPGQLELTREAKELIGV
jgi:hypothetical protein